MNLPLVPLISLWLFRVRWINPRALMWHRNCCICCVSEIIQCVFNFEMSFYPGDVRPQCEAFSAHWGWTKIRQFCDNLRKTLYKAKYSCRVSPHKDTSALSQGNKERFLSLILFVFTLHLHVFVVRVTLFKLASYRLWIKGKLLLLPVVINRPELLIQDKWKNCISRKLQD